MRHAEAVLIQLTEIGQSIPFLASILHECLDAQRTLQRAAVHLLAALCVRDEGKLQAVRAPDLAIWRLRIGGAKPAPRCHVSSRRSAFRVGWTAHLRETQSLNGQCSELHSEWRRAKTPHRPRAAA